MPHASAAPPQEPASPNRSSPADAERLARQSACLKVLFQVCLPESGFAEADTDVVVVTEQVEERIERISAAEVAAAEVDIVLAAGIGLEVVEVDIVLVVVEDTGPEG